MDIFKHILRSLFLFSKLIVVSLAKSLQNFQFQCYGERFLCSFPGEYCSSNVRKCVECSDEVCGDTENIPLACIDFCGGDYDNQKSWFMEFVVLAVIAGILLTVLGFTLIKTKWYRYCKKPTQTDSESEEATTMMENADSQPSDENKQKPDWLKSIQPTDTPSGEYKPTPSSAKLSETNCKSVDDDV